MRPSQHPVRRFALHMAAASLALVISDSFTVTTWADGKSSDISGPVTIATTKRGRLLPSERARRQSAVPPGNRVETTQASNFPTGEQGICGNAHLDAGESCDDGNTTGGDGCSVSCQVETNWTCSDPVSPDEMINDRSFEGGTPSSYWVESSTSFRTPICSALECGLGTGSGPASGEWWAWFGGIETPEESSLMQTIYVPVGASELSFRLEASACDSGNDYLELRIDDIPEWQVDGASELCGAQGYVTQTVSLTAYADGSFHSIQFFAKTFGTNEDVTNYFVDDILIPQVPSLCKEIAIFENSFETE